MKVEYDQTMSYPRKARYLKLSFVMLSCEGALACALLLGAPASSQALFLGFSGLRLAVLAIALPALALSLWLTLKLYGDSAWLEKAVSLVNRLAGEARVINLLVVGFFVSILLVLAGYYGIPRAPLPAFLSIFEIVLARALPMLAWAGLAALQALGLAYLLNPPGRPYLLKAVLVGASGATLLLFYWLGAVGQLVEVNDRMGATDQSAYMEYARRLFETGYTYPGDFNRMPVFPYIQSLLYSDDLSGQSFFLQGKYLNLVLSLFFLGGLVLIFNRYFRPLHTLNLMLVIAFLIFIFKAGTFQAELLFYFLNFCLFWCMWRLLHTPSLKIALLAGVIAGLAHLTKASILPGLVLFLFFELLKGLWVFLRGRRAVQAGQVARNYLMVALVCALVFLASLYPYIRSAKQITGHYFYNVNSTFYMWYDNWNLAVRGTKAHGDRTGWPDMPTEDIPSMSKYFREHSQEQVLHRITKGSRKVIISMHNSYGYFVFIVTYLLALIVAGIVRRRRAVKILTDDPLPFLFYLAYFIVYFLLYAWYVPIASGNRLVLAQAIPLLFIVSIGLHALLSDAKLNVRRWSIHALDAANLVLLVFLAFEIYRVLTFRVWVMYGGS